MSPSEGGTGKVSAARAVGRRPARRAGALRSAASRRAALLLVVAGAVLAPHLARAQAPASHMRQVSAHRALDPTGMLRIWSLTGSVRIVAWDRDSVAVTGTVPLGQQFFCAGRPAATKCGTDVPPSDDGKVAPSKLEFHVPRRSQLWVKTASADITVTGFGGDLDAYSVSGTIRVDGAARVINAESMGGDIVVPASAVTLRARTAAGAITASGGAEDAVLTTVSGPITATGGRFQQAHVESIDGAIHWAGAPAIGASLEFLDHGGDVELRLPAASGADIVVSSYRGDIVNALSPARPVDARDMTGKELRLSLPPANGTRISIRNFKGAVRLLRP